MAFQTNVNLYNPIGVAGAFASIGPYHSVIAGAFQFVAGTAGVTIAAFAWASLVDGTTTNAKPADTTNYALGFVSRNSNIAVITQWQTSYGNLIPSGVEVTLHDRGDFYAVTTTAATVGQKVFASNTNGTIQTGAAGATISGYTETPFSVATVGAANSIIKITAK
jgi:hypothetical protein